MSRSVRSKGSSGTGRGGDNAGNVRERVRELLLSVKEERQHIENRLHENEVYLEQLKGEYQLAKFDNDFSTLNEQQATILAHLTAGLQQLNIDPAQVLGVASEAPPEQPYRQVSQQETLAIQSKLIAQLQQKLHEQQRQ